MEMGYNWGQTESGGSSTESSSLLGGLMFGQRIYFEDFGGGSGYFSSNRRLICGNWSGQSGQIQRCQVEGCVMDLTNAKRYFSRHKVCGMHSKAPKVIVAGLEQRFCQQCSRFHQLPEFDQAKRSCRRRLADHNERRRKSHHSSSPSVSSSRHGKITTSTNDEANADTTMSGSLQRPVSAPSWQINSMNVFSQGSVSGGGGGISFSSPETIDTKLESYKGISDSNCALSLLSNLHDQPHDDDNNNTWRPNNHNQYLNPPWVLKDDDNDMSRVLNLGRFAETENSDQISAGGTAMGEFELSDQHQHHQSRRQYMELDENTRAAYDSSSHHTKYWSL